MFRWVIGAAAAAIGMAGCQQGTAAGEPVAPLQTASQGVGSLGLAFDHAEGQRMRACDGDAPLCMILFDPGAEAFMRDLFTVEVHDGALEAVAAEEAGFVRNADGKLMTTWGRFMPVEVEAFSVNGNPGLRATITCGISDPETGFHAAGGECLWAVVSDGNRSVVISSHGFGNGLEAAEAAVASLRFLPLE